MHRNPLAGLKASRHVLSKTVASCLAETELPYNWASKVRGVVLGICLARSTVLQDIARALGGKVKAREKDLSELLGRKRLGLEGGARRAAIGTLRRRRPSGSSFATAASWSWSSTRPAT